MSQTLYRATSTAPGLDSIQTRMSSLSLAPHRIFGADSPQKAFLGNSECMTHIVLIQGVVLQCRTIFVGRLRFFTKNCPHVAQCADMHSCVPFS